MDEYRLIDTKGGRNGKKARQSVQNNSDDDNTDFQLDIQEEVHGNEVIQLVIGEKECYEAQFTEFTITITNKNE